MMKPQRSLLVVATVAAVFLAAPVGAQNGNSAYERMNPDTLARQLANMGMNELLAELIRQAPGGADSPEQKRLLAAAKIAEYQADPSAPKAQQLLDQAANLYMQVIQDFLADSPSMEKSEGGQAWIDQCGDLRQLARIIGYIQAEPYATKILYLHAVSSDYQRLEVKARQASDVMAQLDQTLMELSDAWSNNAVMIVQFSRDLEQMQDKAALRGGWTRFYYALSIPPDDPDPDRISGRRDLLRLAIQNAQRFIPTNRRYPQAKWGAHLLTGMALRELGEFNRARANLNAAHKKDAPPDVRHQAAFELAKTEIQEANYLAGRAKEFAAKRLDGDAREARRKAIGIFERAGKQVDQYRTTAEQVRGKNHVFTDIYAALLTNFLYGSWADAVEGDAKRVAELTEKAQKPLITFFETHKDNQKVIRYFSKILAAKFAGREDLENLNSMILYAMAVQARARQTEQGKAQARKLLEMIRRRKTETAKSLEPNVLWMLANMTYEQKKAVDAAEMFQALARKHPENPLGVKSAINAVIILAQLVEDRGENVSPDLRAGLIEAIELLLLEGPNAWARRDDVQQWWFELGWHREKLARFRPQNEGLELYAKAIEAYQRVKPDQKTYLQARNQQLWIRATMLRFLPERERKAKAGPLAKDLLTFVEEIRGQLDQLPPERRKLLRNWAALAAFQAYRIQYDMLGQTEALARIRLLPEQWEGTGVLPAAAAFYIEKLIDQQRIDEALAQLKKHQDSLEPEDAKPLFRSVLNETQKRLDDLANDPRYQEEIDRYRQVYFQASDWLYKQAKENNATGRDLYVAEQAYAYALQQGGKYEQALELYQKLSEQEQKKRQEQVEKIEQRLEPLLTDAKDAVGSARRTLDVLDRFKKALDDDQVERERLKGWQSLQFAVEAMEELQGGGTQQQAAQARQRVSRTLIQALENYKQYKTDNVAIDPYNVLGVARSQAALGQLDQALKRYRMLTAGLTPEANGVLFWQVWKEYAALLIKTRSDNRRLMQNLRIKLRTLQSRDANYGGYKSEFERLGQKVDQLAG